MSAWLLAVDLVVSILVVIAGLIDFFGDWRIRGLRSAWIHGLGNGLSFSLRSSWSKLYHAATGMGRHRFLDRLRNIILKERFGELRVQKLVLQ
jgi:hypothetical protein